MLLFTIVAIYCVGMYFTEDVLTWIQTRAVMLTGKPHEFDSGMRDWAIVLWPITLLAVVAGLSQGLVEDESPHE